MEKKIFLGNWSSMAWLCCSGNRGHPGEDRWGPGGSFLGATGVHMSWNTLQWERYLLSISRTSKFMTVSSSKTSKYSTKPAMTASLHPSFCLSIYHLLFFCIHEVCFLQIPVWWKQVHHQEIKLPSGWLSLTGERQKPKVPPLHIINNHPPSPSTNHSRFLE